MNDALLICTDLDRTLIPNGPQPESVEARAMFRQLVQHPAITLAYVSGRDQRLIENAIAQWDLPLPQYVIADVGTSIYQLDSHQQWHPLVQWLQQISADWHGYSHDQLADCLNDIAALTLQEVEKQNQFKLSYYLSLDTDVEKLIHRLTQRFDEINISANVIHSIDESNEVGLLDILPKAANKFRAIETLMELTGFQLNQTVFCGDSGNDLEVLVSSIPSVLVANCMQAVLETASQGVSVNGNQNSLYIAKGNFKGMNGNYSAGMLEGIAHFHPETMRWMEQT